MEQIQQLTLTWLRPPAAWTDTRPQVAAPPELPTRDRVRRVAALHHRQLAEAKQRTGNHYEAMRAQTEALRRFMQELTPEQSDQFMNMYTEESSAVEREWMAKQSGYRAQEPLHSLLFNTLTFLMTVLVIGAVILYVL
jgi:membrane peptidoglycan carboxypeptidase